MLNGVDISTKQAVASNARQGGAIAAVIASLTGNVPNVAGVNRTAEWVVMFAGGVALLIAEHYIGDPSTGSPPPPTA